MNTFFPVGFIIPTADSRNPSTYLGGTWVAIQDRTIVGVGTHALDWTGGNETVTLTLQQIPSHYHNFGITKSVSLGSGYGIDSTSSTKMNTNSQGGGQAHNNMQPSIAKYLWQRTA